MEKNQSEPNGPALNAAKRRRVVQRLILVMEGFAVLLLQQEKGDLPVG